MPLVSLIRMNYERIQAYAACNTSYEKRKSPRRKNGPRASWAYVDDAAEPSAVHRHHIGMARCMSFAYAGASQITACTCAVDARVAGHGLNGRRIHAAQEDNLWPPVR
eukprot:4097755-Pleurochrysis_carterae.AAC.4